MLSYTNTCITSITLQLLTAKVNCIQILQSKCSLVWRQNLYISAAQSGKGLLLVSLGNLRLRNWSLRQVAWAASGFFLSERGSGEVARGSSPLQSFRGFADHFGVLASRSLVRHY